MLNIRKTGQKGFTLIELMIVVAIVGVLAVLAIYGVRKYIANAKTAEARSSVGQIAKLAVAAYERESGDTTIIALGTSSTANARNLCTSSTVVPAAGAPANKKYQSAPSDWKNGDMKASWTCLKFNMDNPQYYAYQYIGNATDFTSVANGDLNGDTVTSTFRVRGQVDSGVARIAPTMEEIDPEE